MSGEVPMISRLLLAKIDDPSDIRFLVSKPTSLSTNRCSLHAVASKSSITAATMPSQAGCDTDLRECKPQLAHDKHGHQAAAGKDP